MQLPIDCLTLPPFAGPSWRPKYADAVVHGYCRQHMGYMDIKTLAETLHDAKDALREFTMNSLDGSMKVFKWYPSTSTGSRV
jgi:hypothetical protein